MCSSDLLLFPAPDGALPPGLHWLDSPAPAGHAPAAVRRFSPAFYAELLRDMGVTQASPGPRRTWKRLG